MFMTTAHWWWSCAVIQGEGSTLQAPQNRLRKPGFSSSELFLLLRKYCFPGNVGKTGVGWPGLQQGSCCGTGNRDLGFVASFEGHMAPLWDVFPSWYETPNSGWRRSKKITSDWGHRSRVLSGVLLKWKAASLCSSQVASMRSWAMVSAWRYKELRPGGV